MSLGDALYEACLVVREGGWVDVSDLRREVKARHQSMLARLESAQLPGGLSKIGDLVEIAFGDWTEAVTMLAVACQEDSPELARWALEKSLSGADTMRRLRQLLEEYSQALCEEADDGDF